MGKRTTFLAVEDDEDQMLLLERAFSDCLSNFSLRMVNSGTEAIRYLQAQGAYSNREAYPIPGVILLDLKMPLMSGFEFLEWLRSQSSGSYRLIPVVAMSSSGLSDDVKRAYQLGANSYLVKPMDWVQFKEQTTALGIFWGTHAAIPEVGPC